MKTSVLLSVIITLLTFVSCGKRQPDGSVIAGKGGYCYRGELKDGLYDGYGVLAFGDSVVYSGQWKQGKRDGRGTVTDPLGRKVSGTWRADTLVSGTMVDSAGCYEGGFNGRFLAEGHGIYRGSDGSWYNGNWHEGVRSGFGCAADNDGKVKSGEWKDGKYRGERLTYTAERVYGIDISRYQHGRGRKKYPINWNKIKISSLGKISRKRVSGAVDYPVSFVYIKSTEGVTVRNLYFNSDYRQARRRGIRCGAYHFFSPTSPADKQAYYFIRHSKFSKGDLPPVLDVEPTAAQVAKMGGQQAMFGRIRTWMNIVRRRTGTRPILYVSQQFVNRYLPSAPDIMRDYMVWIARYGEYKPDVRLAFWQLCPDGRVTGIRGEVDINVFNGYRDQYEELVGRHCVK